MTSITWQALRLDRETRRECPVGEPFPALNKDAATRVAFDRYGAGGFSSVRSTLSIQHDAPLGRRQDEDDA